MKALRLAIVLSLIPFAAAAAGQCEDDLDVVDSALAASPAVETEELLKVQQLRNEAAEDAAAGNKENCVAKLIEAKAILKLQ